MTTAPELPQGFLVASPGCRGGSIACWGSRVPTLCRCHAMWQRPPRHGLSLPREKRSRSENVWPPFLPLCRMQGDFEELVGYEDDCIPESLPEVGGVGLQL